MGSDRQLFALMLFAFVDYFLFADQPPRTRSAAPAPTRLKASLATPGWDKGFGSRHVRGDLQDPGAFLRTYFFRSSCMQWRRKPEIFFSAAERLHLRLAQSAPVLARLHEKLLLWKEQLLPKQPMAEAVNYALGQWQELNVFCSDGAVAIDNNASEREMKRVVLNRKNSLF